MLIIDYPALNTLQLHGTEDDMQNATPETIR
jgi:hypothetical protein